MPIFLAMTVYKHFFFNSVAETGFSTFVLLQNYMIFLCGDDILKDENFRKMIFCMFEKCKKASIVCIVHTKEVIGN